MFFDDEAVKEIDSTYNGEYSHIIIKEKYEPYPEISYPMITIEEIRNESVDRFFDGVSERVSDLAYQFNINATQDEKLTANENARRIAEIIDGYMQGDRYRCFRRIGTPAFAPLVSDNNVMTAYLRYECYLDVKTNTIYRRN